MNIKGEWWWISIRMNLISSSVAAAAVNSLLLVYKWTIHSKHVYSSPHPHPPKNMFALYLSEKNGTEEGLLCYLH